jgi:hypothetical protein
MGIISNLTIRFAFSRMGIDNNLTVFSFNLEKLGRIDGHANFLFLPVTPFFFLILEFGRFKTGAWLQHLVCSMCKY